MIPKALEHLILGIGAPRDRHVACFDINRQAVRVASTQRKTIVDLKGFCGPYICSHDETYRPDRVHDVMTVAENELYECIKESLPKSPDDVLSTALTHDCEYQLRCFLSESMEMTIVEDEPLKLFYVMTARGGATKVVVTDGSRERTGLLRLIRSAWVLSHRAPVVHGCVLEKHGRGIVIAGEKYAGKTTSLLNLCSRARYAIVANDRLLLEPNRSRERVCAIGVPTVVNVRWNAVKPFPELHHLIDAPVFSVSDLAKAVNVEVKREVDITAVAFLSYDKTCRGPVYRRLSHEESYGMLMSHMLSPSEYEWVRMMKIGDVAAERAAVAQKDLLDGVSCFHLRGNETHLEDSAILLDRWCQGAD